MSKLLIITNEFPYGKRETFLESEIKVISAYFDEIVIVPLKNIGDPRELPLNVSVDDVISASYGKKTKWILKTLFSSFFIKTFLKYSSNVKSLANRKLLFKYCTSYNIISSHAPALLEKYRSYTFYSYWYSQAVDAISSHIKSNTTKFITRVHRGDLYEDFTPLGFYPYREESIKKVDAIISISNDGKKYLESKFSAGNIYCSKLGIFDSGHLTSRSAGNRVSVVSVSNIIPVKRVMLIAESLVLYALRHKDKHIVWHHFGHGILHNDVISFLQKESPSNLTYEFYGMVKNTRIYEFYKQNTVDFFINLSESEGIPVSMMEAISFGIPILATDVGGVSEIVTEKTGILLPQNCNSEYVAIHIEDILKSSPDNNDVKRFWFQHYNAEVNYKGFAELIDSKQK